MNSSHEVVIHKLQLVIKKNQKYIISGPNGIGKSFFLKKLVNSHGADAKIHDDVRV